MGGTLLRREKITARNVPSGSVPPVILFYDGECPVCRSAVDWIRARSDPEAFEFFSCHSEDLPRRFPLVTKSACLEAMHLILPDGRVLAGEQAAPEIFSRLWRWRWAAVLFRLPGAQIPSRVLYRWFAGKRHRFSRLLFPPP